MPSQKCRGVFVYATLIGMALPDGGLTAVKLAFDIGTKVVDQLQGPKIDPTAIRDSVMIMQSHVLSAQAALNEAREENINLRRQLNEREELKALAEDLDFVQDGGFWVRKSEREKGWKNPLCPVCWGDSQKAVSMKRLSAGGYRCVIHNTIYDTSESIREEERTARQHMQDMEPRGGGGMWS